MPMLAISCQTSLGMSTIVMRLRAVFADINQRLSCLLILYTAAASEGTALDEGHAMAARRRMDSEGAGGGLRVATHEVPRQQRALDSSCSLERNVA
jgi:hypothetical protein